MTLAQQCHDAFHASTVTVSINALAPPLDSERIKHGMASHWKFSDGSTLIVTGRGASHKMKVRDE